MRERDTFLQGPIHAIIDGEFVSLYQHRFVDINLEPTRLVYRET